MAGRDDPALLILTSLAGGPKHGYAIIQDVEASFGTRMGPGTLYGAISRLESGGLVEALPSTDRRRPYRITKAGVDRLGRELAEMEGVVAIGLRRLKRA
jgi:DNA-binding PadR family transcriptional regulator